MKPAIYWTLISHHREYRVMAVTSEKSGRMVYGRDPDGMPVHISWRHRRGRFDTKEAAQAIVARLVEVNRQERTALAPLEQRIREIITAHEDERKAILAEAGASG